MIEYHYGGGLWTPVGYHLCEDLKRSNPGKPTSRKTCSTPRKEEVALARDLDRLHGLYQAHKAAEEAYKKASAELLPALEAAQDDKHKVYGAQAMATIVYGESTETTIQGLIDAGVPKPMAYQCAVKADRKMAEALVTTGKISAEQLARATTSTPKAPYLLFKAKP